MPAAPRPIPREAPEPRRAPLWHRAIAGLLKAVVPLAILAGAVVLAQRVLDNPPVAGRAQPAAQARLVEVAPVAAAAAGPVVEAWGTVEPARRHVLRAEVGGTVAALHPALAPGGEIAQGAEVLRLDDREFRFEIARAEAEIARVEALMLIERGQGERAASDLSRSGIRGTLTPEQRALVLRAPQMAALEAQRAAAVAARDVARLRAEKAVLAAPFDALVESEQIAPGAVLPAGSEAARLVATDRYRLRIALSPAVLARLDPRPGDPVVLTQPGIWPEGARRMGRVEQVAPALTETGRMAELVVAVDDPLARAPGNAGQPRLLLGSFLNARIEGRALPGAVRIDRAWLRDGGTAWVMTPEDRLEIRRVEIAWRGATEVLVTGGLAPGERVVTTQLATWAEGMALRLAAEGGQ